MTRHKLSIAVFLILFLLGYNLTLSGLQQCRAAPTLTTPPIPAGPPDPPPPPAPPMQLPFVAPGGCIMCDPFGGAHDPCEAEGTSLAVTQLLISTLDGLLVSATSILENYVYDNVYNTLVSEYNQIDWLETSMQSWWDTMWYYNLLPGLQQMTKQLNVELALQTLQLYAYEDASALMQTKRDYAKHEIEDQKKHPVEQVCVAATEMGGLTRATVLSDTMRQAWEAKSLAPGLNWKEYPQGTPNPGATSAAGTDKQRYEDWQNIFCDKMGNSLSDLHCGDSVDGNLINADVLPVKYLFNNLTINVNDTTGAANGNTEGKNLELGLEYLINNLVGVPAMDAVSMSALSSPGGQEAFMLRRSYLARYAAIRAVPDMVAGWRMPGSNMGKWIADLRENRGVVPANLAQDTNDGTGSFNKTGLVLADGISKNPSYKEVMHALSVDRFNSGIYATEMITDPVKVDLEKLDLSVFYLMQLRDYYELLERTALTLAVQVSLLADQQYPGNPNAAAPINTTPPPGG